MRPPRPFDHIPPFHHDSANEPFGVHVIVETPRGSGNKFAYKERYGVIELRRIIRGGMVWPCDFGFIPQTLGDDGDAIDVALLIDEACFPGCLVHARLLGSIGFIKNGDRNDRLVACPISLPGSGSRWDEVHGLDDVPQRLVRELQAFLLDYQIFEGNQAQLTGLGDAAAALQAVRDSAKRWRGKNDGS